MLRRSHATLLLSLLFASTASATHISGGEIYYDCLGGNQYRITLVIYRDCAGIALDNSYVLNIASPCGNKTVTVTTPGGAEISQLCNIELPNSTCNGGSLPGIQQYIYTGTVSLPPCNAWTISWTAPWRNGAIANLVNPGNKQVYIQALLNNAAGPCNNSPHFSNTAIPYVCAGYPITYSYGAIDPEGDSLTYTFISAMNAGAVDLPYVTGFSGTQPITGITLDPQTGEVNFTLNSIGNWVVVVRVDQYDSNGNWVGSIMRDMQFVAYPCTNVPPDPATGTITNLIGDAVQTGPRSLEVCESGNFCFDADITDLNAGDSLVASTNLSASLPGATISYSGANPMSMHICWNGVANSSGFFPFIVTVSDGACPIPAQQTYIYSVHVLPGISLSHTVTNASCTGGVDGTATVNVDVGLAPFTYTWSTGASTPGITAGAGEYHVVVSDANGCNSRPDTAVIGVAPASTANAGPDLTGCFSALPVSLAGTVTNATDGNWSGGTGTFTGAGLNVSYMPSPAEIAAHGVDLFLTTTATGGCPPDQDTVHLTLSNSFFGSGLAKANASCFGTATGSIAFTPDMPGNTYLWNDPAAQSTATASGLAAGNYAVHVTDSLGCDTTLLASITQPGALTIASLTMVPEQCTGTADGSITAVPAGGTAPYHFSWSNGDTTATITVTAGTYSVSITDANGCTPATGTSTVTTLGQTNIADAGPDLTGCFAQLPVQLHGTVTNATGGTWSGGSGSFTGTGLDVTYTPTDAEIAAHAVDLYLTTTGNTSCASDQDTVHLTLSTSFFGSAITAVDASCQGTATGSASFTPDDPGLDFLWNDPAAQTTATAMGLMAGSYAVHVTDSLGCDTTLNTVLSAPAAIAITNLSVVPEQCAGNNDGSVTATVSGGTPPYHYGWSNGDTTASITVGAGTYTLTVTDANNCAPATGSATVISLGQPNAANAGADLIGCFSSLPVQLHGTVTNATGGTWSGGTGSFSGVGLDVHYLPSPAEIAANGVDLVLSTSGNITCASAQDSVHITLPTSFFGSSTSAVNVLCSGDSTGSAIFVPNNPSFTYLWNDPAAQTAHIATGLPAGNYTVHITDSYGCDTTATALVTQPPPLVVGNQVTVAPLCFGSTNGSVSVLVTGGVPVYNYAWSLNAGGQTTSTIINLGAGTYSLTVTDANGCQVNDTATLVAPSPIALAATVQDTVCVNTPIPLTAQASGGSGGYVFNWVGIGTGDSLMHAFAASQMVTVSVTDQAGCAGPYLSLPVYVLNFQLADLHAFGDTVICPGGSAIVSAAVSGYPGSYSIAWTQLGNLGAGPFIVPANDDRVLNVTATDQCGNILLDSVNIDVQTPPSITLPPLLAEGCAPLTVHFPTGLTNQPVTYLWDLGDGSTSTSMAPVHTYSAGDYTVSLTVATPIGCTADALTTGAVHAYAVPVAAFSANPWETDVDHGEVQFTDQTSGEPVTWSWTFGDEGTSEDADPTHTYTYPGTYPVVLQVESSHGCTSTATHDVLIDPVYTVTIPNAFTPNPHGGSGGSYDAMDLSNDVFYPFLRFAKDLRLRIFNRWGELVFESTDIDHGWDGYYKGQLCQQDVYVYQLWVRFIDGKEVQRTGDLTLFR